MQGITYHPLVPYMLGVYIYYILNSSLQSIKFLFKDCIILHVELCNNNNCILHTQSKIVAAVFGQVILNAAHICVYVYVCKCVCV